MVGEPHKRANLEQAGVYYAEKVVIMKMKTAEGDQENVFSDSSAMMLSHIIFDMFTRANIRKTVIIDMDNRSNIKFLRPTGRQVQSRKKRLLKNYNAEDESNDAILHNPFYAPSFAAGGVLCSRMLESVLYQQHFQPSTSEVIRAFCGMADKV